MSWPAVLKVYSGVLEVECPRGGPFRGTHEVLTISTVTPKCYLPFSRC